MSRPTEQEVVEALGWATAEAESELRAHRLRRRSEHAWSLDTPNGVAVHVEVTTTTVTAGTARMVLLASTTGLRSVFRPRRLERTVELALDGEAARVPAVLFLVFEDGGHVYAFESLDEAGGDLESLDLPSLTGAYSDQGETVAMTPGDLFIEFSPTGTYDSKALEELMRASRAPQHLADDPHLFALQVWLSSWCCGAEVSCRWAASRCGHRQDDEGGLPAVSRPEEDAARCVPGGREAPRESGTAALAPAPWRLLSRWTVGLRIDLVGLTESATTL